MLARENDRSYFSRARGGGRIDKAGVVLASERAMVKVVALHEYSEMKNDVLRERLELGRSPKTQHFIALLNEVEVGLLI